MSLLVRFVLLLAVLVPSALAGQTATVFVARHAERTGEPDPPLNEDGMKRAQALARLLADAGVRNFVASETIRAQQTAEPTARAAGRKVVVIDAKDIDGIVKQVRAAAGRGETSLVVGHRNSVPKIAKALGAPAIAPLGSSEHDRLLVLTLLPDGSASVVTLRYGN
jgi:phosphohistidine phosphatase SixA